MCSSEILDPYSPRGSINATFSVECSPPSPGVAVFITSLLTLWAFFFFTVICFKNDWILTDIYFFQARFFFSPFGPHHMVFRILVPRPGIKPWLLAVKAWSPNHLTTREFSCYLFLIILQKDQKNKKGHNLHPICSGINTVNIWFISFRFWMQR